MSGVNWEKVRFDSNGCGNVKELEELLMSCGVEKGNVFRIIRSSVSGYGRDRSYREGRNKGLKELRSEVDVLKRKLSEK